MSRRIARLVLAAATLALVTAGIAGASSARTLTLKKVPKIANEVPSKIRSKGTLTVASDATYAPMEFIASNGKTVVGVDADLAKDLGTVLGLNFKVVNATFATIIPGIKSGKYDVGMSSFTDTKARQKVVDFVTYFSAGTSFYVKASGGPAIKNLGSLPSDKQTAVRNNGGGHINHSLFWEWMSPDGGGEPDGDLAAAIESAFGSFDAFKADVFEYFCHRALDLGVRHAGLFLQRKGDVIFDGQRVKKRPSLKKHAKALAHLRQVPAALMDVLPFHQNLPPIGPYEPDEVLEEYTLPCAAAPYDRQDFTPHDIQAQALEHLLTAEALIELMHLNERHLSHHSSTELRK